MPNSTSLNIGTESLKQVGQQRSHIKKVALCPQQAVKLLKKLSENILSFNHWVCLHKVKTIRRLWISISTKHDGSHLKLSLPARHL